MLGGPFRGTDALVCGRLTRRQLFGLRFRRLFPDVYAPVGLQLDLAVRARAAYLYVRDRGGVLAGYSAALLLGAGCAPANAPAEVFAPLRLTAQPGLRVRRDRIDAAELVEVGGCRLTGPLRTAWDLARGLPLVEAVVAVDALAHRAGFQPADPRAESPQETRLRVGLVLERLPKPEPQYKIVDEHGFVLARVDLAYLEAKLALEYDRYNHLERWRWERDRERDTLLAGYGWETRRFGANDLRAIHRTASIVRNLLARRTPSGSPVPFRS